MSSWTVHLNTAELRSHEDAREFLRAPQVKVAYLLGDSEAWIDYAIDHCELVYVRPYNPFRDNVRYPDETLHHRHKPEECLVLQEQKYRKYKNVKKVRWLYNNEPEHEEGNPNKDLFQQIRWIAKHARLFAEAGYGVGMGGWAAAKSIMINKQNFVHKEAWIPAGQVARDHADCVTFDFHEYIVAHPAWPYLIQSLYGFPDLFFDREALRDPLRWGDIPRTYPGLWSNFYIGRRHHVREFLRQAIGWAEYDEGLGECPLDSMWEDHWKDFIDRRFEPRFGKPKGVLSLRRYWAWINGYEGNTYNQFTDEMFNQFAIELAKYWIKQNSGPHDIYSTWFAYGENVEWQSENVARMPGLIRWMMHDQNKDNTMPTPTPTPEPAPVPVPATEKFDEKYIRSTISQGTNIRLNPTMKSEVIGILPYEGLIAFVSQRLVPSGDHQWRKIVIGDIAGYVAESFIDMNYLTMDVTINLSWQQIKKLKSQLK